MPIGMQLIWLAVLAIPVACVSWTVTHEQVFHEPREYCEVRSQSCQRWWQRKFFYGWTCDYCLSHYVSALFVGFSGFTMLLTGWRGTLIAWLAVVWVANQYMSLFNRLRRVIKDEKIEVKAREHEPGPPPAR